MGFLGSLGLVGDGSNGGGALAGRSAVDAVGEEKVWEEADEVTVDGD